VSFNRAFGALSSGDERFFGVAQALNVSAMMMYAVSREASAALFTMDSFVMVASYSSPLRSGVSLRRSSPSL